MVFNPGAAGEYQFTSITGIYRDQWSGIIGRPQSQDLIINFKGINNRFGFGFSLHRYSIGIQESVDINGIYAYKIRLGNGVASMGIQMSYRNFVNDFTSNSLITIDGFENDPSIEQVRFQSSIFNVGLGFYYKTKQYYFGLAAPRMFRSDLDAIITNSVSKESRHYYVMAGLELELNNEWKFQPQALYKYAENAPYDIDITGMFSYQDQMHMGVNLRTGGSQSSLLESIDLLMGLKLKNSLYIGVAYDFTLTEIREFENGSFEVLISYDLGTNKGPDKIQNPRYFR